MKRYGERFTLITYTNFVYVYVLTYTKHCCGNNLFTKTIKLLVLEERIVKTIAYNFYLTNLSTRLSFNSFVYTISYGEMLRYCKPMFSLILIYYNAYKDLKYLESIFHLYGLFQCKIGLVSHLCFFKQLWFLFSLQFNPKIICLSDSRYLSFHSNLVTICRVSYTAY